MKQLVKLSMLLLFSNCCILSNSFAQKKAGVQFEEERNWSEINTLAKKENKYILLDFYTTWCGPCRQMDAKIFPLAEVGDYFNEKFISVKVQVDTTGKDDTRTKRWYKDAEMLTKKHNVSVFPTYIILNLKGDVMHRFSGYREASDFIKEASVAFGNQLPYGTLVTQFKEGKKDSVFLYKLIAAARKAADYDIIESASATYIQNLKDPLKKENLEFMLQQVITRKISDPGFQILLNNYDRAISVVGKDAIDDRISNIVLVHIFYIDPKTYEKEPDWNKLNEELEQKYPHQATLLKKYVNGYKANYIENKLSYYANRKDIASIQNDLINYAETLKNRQNHDRDFNGWAWNTFLYSDDKKTLEAALTLSEASFSKDTACSSFGFRDTYANILYKLYKLYNVGSLEKAIEWEEKAASCADSFKYTESADQYRSVVKMMKDGEKTWEVLR